MSILMPEFNAIEDEVDFLRGYSERANEEIENLKEGQKELAFALIDASCDMICAENYNADQVEKYSALAKKHIEQNHLADKRVENDN